MKAFIIAAALSLAAFPALAQSSSGSVSQSGASAGVSINNPAYRGVPSAIGPGLTASGLACLGSVSFGVSGMGWGAGPGFTYPDRACNIREDAKYIHGVTGDVEAAKERLCDSRQIRHAYARAGRPCYEDRVRTQRVSARQQPRTHVKVSGYARPAAASVGWVPPAR